MLGTAWNGAAFAHDNTVAPKEEKVLPLFSCKGKTAIVSGGASGIGFAVTHALAEAGANVAIWYNSSTSASDRAKEIEKEYGVNCKAYQVNITDAQQIQDSVNTVIHDFHGRLDIFVANAGIFPDEGNIIDRDLDNYRNVIATDLDSVFYCARTAATHWRRQKREGTDAYGNKLDGFTYGSFVATASISGRIVDHPQLQAAYSTAKAAVIQLCRSLSVEWVQFARANSVSPGAIKSAMTDSVPQATQDSWKEKIPMGRMGLPHELKGVYLYLCSDASSYTTGVDIVVDGGYVLL
ncbi:Sorbose reductase sou1 [Toensbergia leucococca]|nr:Sorbose reductase sou1 [Toensbergia leucococca]